MLEAANNADRAALIMRAHQPIPSGWNGDLREVKLLQAVCKKKKPTKMAFGFLVPAGAKGCWDLGGQSLRSNDCDKSVCPCLQGANVDMRDFLGPNVDDHGVQEMRGMYMTTLQQTDGDKLKVDSGILEIGKFGDIIAFLLTCCHEINSGIPIGFAFVLLAQFGSWLHACLPRTLCLLHV